MAELKPERLAAQLAAEPLRPAYLIAGPEALIVLEALSIAIVGSIVGYALGSYLIGYAADSISATNTGWTLPYAFPWGIAAGLAPLLIVVTVLAAVYPARVALSVSPAEALEFE